MRTQTHTHHSHLSDTSPPCALAVVGIIQSVDWLNLLPPYYKTQGPVIKRRTHMNNITSFFAGSGDDETLEEKRDDIQGEGHDRHSH